MNRSDLPEKKAKCNICARGLTGIEVSLNGLLCAFCAPKKRALPLLNYLAMAKADWEIYFFMRKLFEKYGQQTAHERLSAVTGMLGFIDVSYVETVEQKREVVRELAKMCGKKSSKRGRHQKRRKQ